MAGEAAEGTAAVAKGAEAVAAWEVRALARVGIMAEAWAALAAVETWGGMAQIAPVEAGTTAAWAPRVQVAGGTAGRAIPWQTGTETAIETMTGIET